MVHTQWIGGKCRRYVTYVTSSCVDITWCALSGSVASVGAMSHTLRVQATDDGYQTTKEKMTLADEEVKKVR